MPRRAADQRASSFTKHNDQLRTTSGGAGRKAHTSNTSAVINEEQAQPEVVAPTHYQPHAQHAHPEQEYHLPQYELQHQQSAYNGNSPLAQQWQSAGFIPELHGFVNAQQHFRPLPPLILTQQPFANAAPATAPGGSVQTTSPQQTSPLDPNLLSTTSYSHVNLMQAPVWTPEPWQRVSGNVAAIPTDAPAGWDLYQALNASTFPPSEAALLQPSFISDPASWTAHSHGPSPRVETRVVEQTHDVHAHPVALPVGASPETPSYPPQVAPASAPASTVKAAKKGGRGKKARQGEDRAKALVVSKRSGPLSQLQREKADEMRYLGSCWRCRRYRKPCNGPGVCNSCLTSGFRVWPSSIGCRRGYAADVVLQTVPPVAEEVLADLPFELVRLPNWRTRFGLVLPPPPEPAKSPPSDKWEELKRKVRSTLILGTEVEELIEMAAAYQRVQQKKEEPQLAATCTALSAACDLYHTLVSTSPTNIPPTGLPTPCTPSTTTLPAYYPTIPPPLPQTLRALRAALTAGWRHFLPGVFAGRRTAWLPSFLSICLYICTMILLLDAAVAVPDAPRAAVWRDVRGLVDDVRHAHYRMAIDCLRVLARGAWPLRMACWGWVERPPPPPEQMQQGGSSGDGGGAGGGRVKVRDPTGMALVADDAASFDGFARLQQWGRLHGPVMAAYGRALYGTAPFTEAQVPPIAALFRVFEEGEGEGGNGKVG